MAGRGTTATMALERARMLMGLRELPKYYLIVALNFVRRQLSIVGYELAAAGRIVAGLPGSGETTLTRMRRLDPFEFRAR